MAVTETPAETVDAAAEAAGPTERPPATGLAAVLGSGDHKVIGRLYIGGSLLFGLVVMGLALAYSVEAFDTAETNIFRDTVAFPYFTLVRVGAVFLLAMPLLIGVAMAIVPMQVGARSIAFPRAAAASFWGWLLGGGLLISSYLAGGGPAGTDDKGISLWIASMGMVVVSLLLAAVCLATTVLALRTPGMDLSRVPLTAWSFAVASIMWLLTLPVLFGGLVVMYVDHRHAGGISIGDPGAIYGAMAWIFRNPQIYVIAIPVLGFIADVAITISGTRVPGRTMAQSAIGVFGVLSFGAFLVAPSEAALESAVVVVMGVLAVVPVLAVGAVAGDALRRGKVALNGGLVAALASFLLLLLGTVAGAIAAIPGALDAPEGGTAADSIFTLGVTHAVVLSAVVAGLGGIGWWSTKIGRRPADDKLGAAGAVLILLGGLLMVVPDLVAGLFGEGQELIASYEGGIEGLNIVAGLGTGVVILGALAAIVSLAPMLRRGDDEVDADPWGGQSLEWLTTSPPPLENFTTELAVVTSAEPLFDLREEK